jgi:outer membrane translocation and assembly module TamA
VHATVFVDAGQVAPTASRLFNDWKTGTGFSLSYMRGGATLGRLDVGYGSGEGMHFFWSFGGFLQ